ncbi:xanthine dehydrogenase family protein molybdopterin-binding subunit [Ktedonospora formicarum]|uniref:Xanthine dehydrogenase n=1 Tax=Ktedonospora formicarum TaxID=2778364 RepID=A0A8J3IDS8_9CHLR|nr:xanthine dehydrogenase family protein molybdopterin-binding subunit [Ktedonospora formicarum]GHO50164.1 xanthine dehydrogenase [Ktedonospora formicarum]
MTQAVEQTSTQNLHVGKRTRRQDAPDKLTGRTRFTGDISHSNLLHARLALSPYAHAKINSIDISAALEVPGVVAVYTGETLELTNPTSSSRTQSPLAIGEVCWSGHPVAAVVAETEAAAEDGVALVDVDYEPLPVAIDPEEAIKPSSPLARTQNSNQAGEIAGGDAHAAVDTGSVEEEEEEALSENVCNKVHMKLGDIEAGWREAEVVIEHTVRTRPVHQSYMEPQSILVAPSVSGHQMVVWPSSQGMLGVRSDISKALDVPERQVRVESVPIGGAFGGKFGLIEPLGAALAYRTRKPVRLVFTRQEDLMAGNPAPQAVISLKLGAKRDGTLVAFQGKAILDSGAYAGAGAGLLGYLLTTTYRCPNYDLRCYEVLTNKVSVGAYRAPGAPQAAYAMETAVDKLCAELGMDLLEFRKLNALREGDLMIDHRNWPRLGLVECIEELQKHPLWVNRAEEKQNLPAELEGWKGGIGVAIGGWPGGTEPAAAACRLESDGTLSVVLGTVDLTGSDTTMAMIAAEGLGLSVDNVNVVHDSTDTMPYSGGTGGSKTVYSMGPAVLAAVRDARQQILSIASNMLEAAEGDLEIEDGKVVVRGVPNKNVSLKEVAKMSTRRYEPVYGRGRAGNTSTSPMYSAHLVKLAVDPDTGEVKVLDYVAVQDVGRALNPAEIEGQMHGGITQGLGWALFEGYEYDENGQLLTPTLMDYALPHSFDVPHISTIMVEIPAPLGPYGAKGIGEPPVVPVAGAVVNAIADAVGVNVLTIPVTPERLFTALNEA